MMDGIEWIAVDWGTSNVRAWAIGARGQVLDRSASGKGMGQLAPEGFEPALIDLIGPWIGDEPAEVVACGMVGARQGWTEAAYGTVPCPPLAPGLTPAPVTRPGLTVGIVAGLSQASPADVMRGEETQIAGFLTRHPRFDGVLCLPGTHSKWVHISAGEVVSFRTVMTGEMFTALSQGTVLRHSIGADGWDETEFEVALSDTLSRPEHLTGRLFSIRAEGLLLGLDPGAARARLSGLLIGAELAATRPWWLGREVAVIGAGAVRDLYLRALAMQGVSAIPAEAEATTLAGLAAARTAAQDRP